jgi:hypothetical protein
MTSGSGSSSGGGVDTGGAVDAGCGGPYQPWDWDGGACAWTVPCVVDLGMASEAGSDAGTSPDAGTVTDAGSGGALGDAALFSGSSDLCVGACNATQPTGIYVRPYDCIATATAGPNIGVSCDCRCTSCQTGRPPRGFTPRLAGAPNLVAERLAQMAQLEAASVDAFHALHTDLATFGAPRSLLAAVQSAAKDEIRHARMASLAAERFGARVPQTQVAPIPRRSLAQLAVENAEEGCVRETFGAALAAMQAERASDPRLRRMMRRIARDELEHAALAWRIAAWLVTRLDAKALARVQEARDAALDALENEMAHDLPGDDVLGLPRAREMRAALARIRAALATGDLAA